MSEHTVRRKKSGASNFTNPSLSLPDIPTLTNPIRGGLQTNNTLSSPITKIAPDLLQDESGNQQLSQSETIQQKPLSHDISRISLRRPQTKFSLNNSNGSILDGTQDEVNDAIDPDFSKVVSQIGEPNVLQRDDTNPQPIGPPTPPPEIISWQTVITPGTVQPGKPRPENRIFAGDTLTVTVAFDPASNPKQANLRFDELTIGSVAKTGNFQITKDWISDTKYAWKVTALAPGGQGLLFDVVGAASQGRFNFDLTAVADPRFFKDRCTTAETALNTLHASGRKWFESSFDTYQTAYSNYTKVLSSQKLVDDLLVQAIFTVAAGAAGGAVGAGAGKIFEEIFTKGARSAAFTDAVKDLTKFAARSPLLIMSQGSKPAGAVIEPLKWMTGVNQMIAAEREQVGEILLAMHKKVDNLLVTNPNEEFDQDPVEVITEACKLAGQPLNELGSVPSVLDWESTFWIAHIRKFVSYYSYGFPTPDCGVIVEDAIDKVAKQNGSTAKQWILSYGTEIPMLFGPGI